MEPDMRSILAVTAIVDKPSGSCGRQCGRRAPIDLGPDGPAARRQTGEADVQAPPDHPRGEKSE